MYIFYSIGMGIINYMRLHARLTCLADYLAHHIIKVREHVTIDKRKRHKESIRFVRPGYCLTSST